MALDLADLRRRLQERRQQLIERYQSARARIVDDREQRDVELEENAAEQWDERVLTAFSDSDAHALEAVTAALVRMDEGAYGRCVVCGEPIDEARLEALPETPLCARDAEASEEPRASGVPFAQ